MMTPPSWITKRESEAHARLRDEMRGRHFVIYDEVSRYVPARVWEVEADPVFYDPNASLYDELLQLADGKPHLWHSPRRQELLDDGLICKTWDKTRNMPGGDVITDMGRSYLKMMEDE